MSNAEKLLFEAEFAFRNISPGSTDEKKYTARAKRYASKLLRKYPASPEAEQAQIILRRLGVAYATAKPRPRRGLRPQSKQPLSPSPHADHTSEAPHRHSAKQREAITKALALPSAKKRIGRGAQAKSDDSWENIWRTLLGLSYTKKKMLAFLSIFVIVIIGFTPFLWLVLLYYAVQPAYIRGHAHKVVTYFA